MQEQSDIDATGRLPRLSIAREATAFARRMAMVSIVGMLLMLAAFVLDRVAHERVHEAAIERLFEAERIAGSLLLADERLTMSAYLAATTGNARWIERYEASIPDMDKAIAEATAIAPPAISDQFRATTSEANDRLVQLERKSFDALRSGDAASALRILESDAYQLDKQVLSDGTAVFLRDIVDSIKNEVQAAESRQHWSFVGVLLAALLLILLLWWAMFRKALASGRAFHRVEHKMKIMALQDSLTGLPNRVSLEESLRAAFSRARRRMGKVSALMIDLDGFKPVNDQYGHEAGDQVLCEVAQRLAATLREGELCARHGGDEFVVLIEHGDDVSVAEAVAMRVNKALSRPFKIKDGTVSIGASIGIATFPDESVSEQELLGRADEALYQVKRAGGSGVQRFLRTT